MKKEAPFLVVILLLLFMVYTQIDNRGLEMIIGNIVKQTIKQENKLEASIELKEYEINVVDKDIEITSLGRYTLETEELTFVSKKENINLINFRGNINYINGQFILEGKTNKIKKENSEIKINKEIKIILDDAILNLNINNLNLNTVFAKGNLSINKKITLILDDTYLSLEDYSGKINLENSHSTLDGDVLNFKTTDNGIEVTNK